MEQKAYSKTRIFSFAQLQVASADLRKAWEDLKNSPTSNVSTFVGSYNNWYSTVFQTASGVTDIALSIVDLYFGTFRDGTYNHWNMVENAEDILQGTRNGVAVKVRFDYFPTGIMMPDGGAILGVQLSNGTWITPS